MSGRFVSTGAIDTKTGDAVALPPPPPPAAAAGAASTTGNKRNDHEWAAVQAQLEAERQAREARRKAAVAGEAGGGGRSLFEVLEANKAAKQAAFEEANKIRNQFRALDEDEVGFLEEVEARKREEAERGRRELEEGLRVFREARKEEGENGGEEEGVVVEGGWKVGGKRKRRKGEGEGVGLLKGVKRRVGSGEGGTKTADEEKDGDGARREGKLGGDDQAGDEAEAEAETSAATEKKVGVAAPEPAVKGPAAAAAAAAAVEVPKPKPKLGLVAYDSDDDSD